MDVRKAAEAARDYLVSIRREFHQHPELSMQEFRTAQRIEEELDRLGIPHTRVGETGVLGTLRGEKEGGRAVVLRADIDALPIEETHECAYRSQNPGVMHACGTVGLKPGLNNAAVDHFRIEVHGKSTHVSTPHLGTDALYIASQIVVAVQGLVTRMTSPTEPVIIGIGCLNAGTTYNAVAEHAVMEGTTRTVSQESRDRIRRLVSETADSIAAIYGGTAEIVWTDFAAALINDAEVCREAAAVTDSMLGEGHVVTDRELSLSGDNFAEFELYRPGAYAYLGTGNPDKPHTVISNHNGGFDVDEDALVTGAALYAGYALASLG